MIRPKSPRVPVFRIYWSGHNITDDVGEHVLTINYTDFAGGKSDSLEVNLEDRLDLWKGPWYPSKGDTIRCLIGYEGEPMLNCGSFEIDSVEFTGGGGTGDEVHVYAIATNITKKLRQKNSWYWEDKSLSQILGDIAGRNGLGTHFDLMSNPVFKRIDQRHQTDIQFAKKLAGRFGHETKVAENILYVISEDSLASGGSAMTITRGDVLRFHFQDQLNEIFQKCRSRYFDPKENKLFEGKIEGEDVKPDTLEICHRVENKGQAEAEAKGRLARMNKWIKTGSLDLTGTQELCAGISVTLEGWSSLDGLWVVEESRHSFCRSRGYTTVIRIRKV